MRHPLTGRPAVRYPDPVPALAERQVWMDPSGRARVIWEMESGWLCWRKPSKFVSRRCPVAGFKQWIRESSATMTGVIEP